MRLTLPEPHIPEKGGFTSKNDIFGYRKFGERLANLVSNINEPLVITLDGSWGSGKSVFIKQWAGLMRKRGGKVVYFDAFANDFHSNAFLALASEIYSIAKKTLGKSNPSTKEFLKSANKVVRVLASKGTDIALRLGTSGNVNLKDIRDVVKASENESEKVISEQLQKANEERASLKAFRDSLSDVSKSIAENNQDASQFLPLVFIVDELDRCRPPFALEILEHIKHLFSVENVCFVLVTNLTQMEAIIKKTYGAETNAGTYLEKFYHHRIVLPKTKNGSQKQRNEYLGYLWKNLNPVVIGHEGGELVRKEMLRLVNVHELSLREIEHVLRNFILAGAAAERNQLFVPPVVAGLCVMRLRDMKLYERARENKLSWEDTYHFLKITAGSDDESVKHREDVTGFWRYFVDQNAHNEESLSRYFNVLDNYNLPDGRLSSLHIFTNLIDNFADYYMPE